VPIDWKELEGKPRILIEAALKPVAGTRIQPTGFPDLGAATYDAPPTTDEEKKEYPKGVPTLLVESAQSMANRLEAVCWDEGENTLAPELDGLPYVRVKLAGLGDGTDTTTSLQEFHRLNSPYIMSGVNSDGKAFADVLRPEFGMSPVAGGKAKGKGKAKEEAGDEGGDGSKDPDDVPGVVNLRKLAAVCFKYDPNSLVHGVFLEKIAGRLRHPRALSAFIEASGVGRADSGGVKFDRVIPDKADFAEVTGISANRASEAGYVNVPFHRTEFTAKSITAYFTVDLAQIRGYGLGDDATKLLVALSLWKVRQFLDSTMRLRSACELEIDDAAGVQGKRPNGFTLPAADELTKEVAALIKKCKSQFVTPSVTELTWSPESAKKAIDEKKAKKKKEQE
jgi:CRISPR-associated protein Csb1